jgi:hypothetical protein
MSFWEPTLRLGRLDEETTRVDYVGQWLSHIHKRLIQSSNQLVERPKCENKSYKPFDIPIWHSCLCVIVSFEIHLKAWTKSKAYTLGSVQVPWTKETFQRRGGSFTWNPPFAPPWMDLSWVSDIWSFYCKCGIITI